MKPNAWRAVAAVLAVLAIAAALLIAWWLRGPRVITSAIYYNQVNYFYSAACGCRTDAHGHRAGLPAIVNGDVHVDNRDASQQRALHRAAPVLFPAPAHSAIAWLSINNGDLYVRQQEFERVPQATIAPPPVRVSEPDGAWLLLFGVTAIGGMARLRARHHARQTK